MSMYYFVADFMVKVALIIIVTLFLYGFGMLIYNELKYPKNLLNKRNIPIYILLVATSFFCLVGTIMLVNAAYTS